MAANPKPPKNADDPEQSERFIEAARKHGADTPEAREKLERLFKRAVPSGDAATPKKRARKARP
jgi:hypothetical protein